MLHRRHPPIRGALRSNTEDRKSLQERLDQDAFGIYRPVTAYSSRALEPVLANARDEINDYLYWKPGKRFSVQNSLGITYMMKLSMQSAIKKDAQRRQFRTQEFRERLADDPRLRSGELIVALGEFAWMGETGRKLAIRFDDREAVAQLRGEADAINDALDETGASLEARTPDHLTVFRFGSPREGHEYLLNDMQRQEIEVIAERHLAAASLGPIVLGNIMLGRGYDAPHQVL